MYPLVFGIACHRASLMNSLSLCLFIAYNNDEQRHFVLCVSSQTLISLLHECRFFLFLSLLLFFSVQSTSYQGIDVSFSILLIKRWSCFQVPKRSFGSVQFVKKFELHLISKCIIELLAAENLCEINISIYYISLIVFCFLDALKKSSKKKEMGIEKEKVRLL